MCDSSLAQEHKKFLDQLARTKLAVLDGKLNGQTSDDKHLERNKTDKSIGDNYEGRVCECVCDRYMRKRERGRTIVAETQLPKI